MSLRTSRRLSRVVQRHELVRLAELINWTVAFADA